MMESRSPPLQELETSSSKSFFSTPLEKKSISRNVRAVVRIRPLSDEEIQSGCSSKIHLHMKQIAGGFTAENDNLTKTHGTSLLASGCPYDFDSVLAPEASQEEVYDFAVGEELSQNTLTSRNISIIAYGQTGGGKTFTMFGRRPSGTKRVNKGHLGKKENEPSTFTLSSDSGIIARAICDLFSTKQRHESTSTVLIEMSFIEIWNEELRDLLDDTDKKLKLGNRGDGGVEVRGMASIAVATVAQAMEVMDKAILRRMVASTRMNSQSSRSHAICTLTVTTKAKTTTESSGILSTKTTLTLVDLAGSERSKATGVSGSQQQESININSDLLALGKVLSALSAKKENRSRAMEHIPYRDSKLTRLLRDSLEGNCFTVFLACVSPACRHLKESINTLRYAQRSRRITNVVKVDSMKVETGHAEFGGLLAENRLLRDALTQLQEASAKDFEMQQQTINNLSMEVDRLRSELHSQALYEAAAAAAFLSCDMSSLGDTFEDYQAGRLDSIHYLDSIHCLESMNWEDGAAINSPCVPETLKPTRSKVFNQYFSGIAGEVAGELLSSNQEKPLLGNLKSDDRTVARSFEWRPQHQFGCHRPDAVKYETDSVQRHLSPPVLRYCAASDFLVASEPVTVEPIRIAPVDCPTNGAAFHSEVMTSLDSDLDAQANLSLQHQLEDIRMRLLGLEQSVQHHDSSFSRCRRNQKLEAKATSRPYFPENLPEILAFRQRSLQESAQKSITKLSNTEDVRVTSDVRVAAEGKENCVPSPAAPSREVAVAKATVDVKSKLRVGGGQEARTVSSKDDHSTIAKVQVKAKVEAKSKLRVGGGQEDKVSSRDDQSTIAKVRVKSELKARADGTENFLPSSRIGRTTVPKARAKPEFRPNAEGKENCNPCSIRKGKLNVSAISFSATNRNVEKRDRPLNHNRVTPCSYRITDFKVERIELAESQLIVRFKGSYQQGPSPSMQHKSSKVSKNDPDAAILSYVKPEVKLNEIMADPKSRKVLQMRSGESVPRFVADPVIDSVGDLAFRQHEVVFVLDGNKGIKYEAIILEDIPRSAVERWVWIKWSVSRRSELVALSKLVKICDEASPMNVGQVIRRRSNRAPQPTNRFTP